MFKKYIRLGLLVLTAIAMASMPSAYAANSSSKYVQTYQENYPEYLKHDKVIADAFLADYNDSEAQALVARAIWYMENGYMVYGHSKYWDTGFIDCSNFVSLVYKDFGYKITSASKNYNQVGKKVAGVYSRKIAGSTKYELVGAKNLRPGDIFTFWKDDTDGSGTHIGHVALYVGEVNGVSAVIQTNADRPTAIGIRTDFRYWYGEHFIEARRVLDDDSQVQGKEWQATSPVIPAIYQLSPQQPVIMPANRFMSYNGINSGVDVPLPIDQIPDENSDDATEVTGGSSGEDLVIPTDQIANENSDTITDINAGSNEEDIIMPTDPIFDEKNDTITTDAEINSPKYCSDIDGHWAESSINKLLQIKYINGYPDGTFKPDNAISRAEFVTMLVNAFKLNPATGKGFSDTAHHWASADIATAQAHGIVQGYSDKFFKPDEFITREQMVVMIINAAHLDIIGYPTDVGFSDHAQISDWAYNAVLTAENENLINGYPDGNFKPQTHTTRAEAVTVIKDGVKL